MDILIYIVALLIVEIVGFAALGLIVAGICWIAIKLSE
jgi:hypothetical protein